MPTSSRSPRLFLRVLLVIGLLAGLLAAKYRLHVEGSNKRVEIALEWDEVSRLAQFSHQPVSRILQQFHAVHVTALVVQEDTFTTFEQSGVIHPTPMAAPGGRSVTFITGLSQSLCSRIHSELAARGIQDIDPVDPNSPVAATEFIADPEKGTNVLVPSFTVPVDYANLRTIGLGLPPEALRFAAEAHLDVAGRIGNFPGVSPESAHNVLKNLADEGVSIVIFNGEEVLGYRDLEPQVSEMLKSGSIHVVSPTAFPQPDRDLAYGAVEFGKQKGDEKLAAKLKGDLIRVHSIQAGEMGQLDREEAIDRFAKAARERNIRFCYVRLLTFAGDDPVGENIKFLNQITRAINHGSALVGGNLQFGLARRFQETHTPTFLAPLIALGVAGGLVWMLTLITPLPEDRLRVTTIVLCIVLPVITVALGDTGHRLMALLAGIVMPAAACLYTFPALEWAESPLSPKACGRSAIRALLTSSGITAIGIVYVIGLLASRPYMVHVSQFLGIKAQHAVPLLLVALVALFGGTPRVGETFESFKKRAGSAYRAAMSEPARFGTLIFGLIVLAGLALVIARTGNDAGVGVSGSELKMRAILDRIMPVRPRTKEFLVGHPAFVLGICWWLRGRRRLAVPAVVIGSLGQVSLLNTFCHIHTPMIISAWRDVIGLIVGSVIGLALFFIGERIAGTRGEPL